MHPAAVLQFERMIDEYARWRAVPEKERSPAPAWWWGPAMELRDMRRAAAGGMVRQLGSARAMRLMRRARKSSSRRSQDRPCCPGPTIFPAKRYEATDSRTRSTPRTAPAAVRRQRLSSPDTGFRLQRRRGEQRRRRASSSAICLGGSGLENRKPCISSQAWLRRNACCSGGLDALGNDGHAERLAHADDRLRDGLVLGIDRQVANEGAVDLDGVDRELLHQRHRRIAGTEIVDRKANAAALDRVQHLDRARRRCASPCFR